MPCCHFTGGGLAGESAREFALLLPLLVNDEAVLSLCSAEFQLSFHQAEAVQTAALGFLAHDRHHVGPEAVRATCNNLGASTIL